MAIAHTNTPALRFPEFNGEWELKQLEDKLKNKSN